MAVDSQARPPETLRTRLRIYDSIINSREVGIQYAANLAAEQGRPVEVQGINAAGEVVITWRASPVARPVDIAQTAAGTPPTEPVGRESREQQIQAQRSTENIGVNNEGDTPDNPSTFSPSIPLNQLQVYLGNAERTISAVIPSVEALLISLPNEILNQFTQSLPPIFQSLLPIGVIAGIVTRQPVSLNNLLNLAAGALLGSTATQLIRSATDGIRLVSGLTGSLAAIPISRVSGAIGGTNIPTNIPIPQGNISLLTQPTSSANQAEIERLIENVRRAEANQEAVVQRLRQTGQGSFEERNQAMLDAAISSRQAREQLSAAIARNNPGQHLQGVRSPQFAQTAGVSYQIPGISTITSGLNAINQTINQTVNSALVISNVVNNVSTLLTGNQALGNIPVNIANIGLVTNIALRSIESGLSIPTRVLGIATNLASTPISSIISGTLGSRIPLRGTNLSLPNLPVLSGLVQRISPELANNIIPRTQVARLLPTNLRNQIPGIPTSGRNNAQIRREAAPERVPEARRPVTQEREPLVSEAEVSGEVDYSIKVSSNYTLAQVSRNTHFPHRIVPQLGLTTAKIIENLSLVAVNILEPIRAQYPGFLITSGFRQGQNTSDHNRGQAVDIQWNGRTADFHLDVARWITENLQYKQLIFEHSPRGSIWLHVAYEKNGNRRQNLTMINNRYTPGLTNHYGQRRA
jgi:hypothetical protein